MSTMQQAGPVYALLADGSTVEIRPADPGDFNAVKAMHEAMSPDNAYFRFFGLSRTAAEAEARQICREPGPGRVALLALADGEVVGCVSYETLRGQPDHRAEVAFAVADHMHHKGVATLLLEHLVFYARSHQITAFTGQTLAENTAMLKVFADAGLPVHRSGGGSSIAEKAIDDEISLDNLIVTYRALVYSGAPIAEINAIRKHLSAIKGGRLAQAALPAQQVSILVSDVPDNTPDALASGPTMPDTTSVEDCYAIAAKHRLPDQFPASVRELFHRHALEETPKSDDPAFHRSRWWAVLSNATLLESCKAEAERHRFAVEVDNSCDDWDYMLAADYLLGRLGELRKNSERVCLISGGEVTVKVTNGGVGGRNQQFALACAQKIAGENITVLSAGTDGIDGNSPAAGAIADGTTLERAKSRGLESTASLLAYNAYPFFDALGDTIMTGPTGNNLRDLRILLAY